MHPFKKMIFSTVNIITNTAILEQGGRSTSSSANGENSCSILVVDITCYFDTSVNGKITSGDTVYDDASGASPFIGGNQYYKVLLGSSYVVLINNLGVMNISTICI